MAEDDLVGVFVEPAEGDESAAFFDLVGAGDAEALGVGEDAGVPFLDEDAFACRQALKSRRRGSTHSRLVRHQRARVARG